MASRLEIMREFVPASPLVRHLGIELRALERDRAELVLPFDERLVTLADVVHGGAIASLIDTAGMAATWADPDVEPESVAGATISMNVDYVAAARGKELRDKRRDIAARDAQRQIDRELKSLRR